MKRSVQISLQSSSIKGVLVATMIAGGIIGCDSASTDPTVSGHATLNQDGINENGEVRSEEAAGHLQVGEDVDQIYSFSTSIIEPSGNIEIITTDNPSRSLPVKVRYSHPPPALETAIASSEKEGSTKDLPLPVPSYNYNYTYFGGVEWAKATSCSLSARTSDWTSLEVFTEHVTLPGGFEESISTSFNATGYGYYLVRSHFQLFDFDPPHTQRAEDEDVDCYRLRRPPPPYPAPSVSKSIVNDRAHLSWSSIPGATSYDVRGEFYLDGQTTTGNYTTTSTSFTGACARYGGVGSRYVTYFVRARGDGSKEGGAWSSGNHFWLCND